MIRISLSLTLFLLLCGKVSDAQEFDPFIASWVEQVSYDSVLKNLQEFESLGIKAVNSQELGKTADWLVGKHLSYGYTDIERDTFYYGIEPTFNIIVTKTGTKYPDTYLILDAHYDTWGGPGVNDNGSGTAIILEVARLLAGIDTEYSIRFIHFSAEEAGMVGSSHYVENTVIPQDMDILLVFNIDEVGGVAGSSNDIITCERDESPPNGNNQVSWLYTDTLVTLTGMYSDLETYIDYAYGSDYVPFQEAGYIITGYYEYNHSPWVHSINDSLSKLDTSYVFMQAKSSMAASMYFSGAYDVNPGRMEMAAGRCLSMKPNPFTGFLDVANPSCRDDLFLRICDATGRIWRTGMRLEKGENRIRLDDLPGGLYCCTLVDAYGRPWASSYAIKLP
jgi:hypothetical protein